MGDDALLEKKKFTYTWRLQNYSLLIVERNEYFCSPTFAVEEFEDTKWNLRLCYGYHYLGKIDWINCYLYREDTGKSDKCKLDVRISLISSDGTPWFESKYEDVTLSKAGHYKFNRFKFETIDRNKEEFLPRDTLTIRCEMWSREANEPTNNLCFACTRVEIERMCFTWDKGNMVTSRAGEIISICQQLALRRLAEMRIYVNVMHDKSIQLDFVIERGKTCVFATCDVLLKDESGATMDRTRHEYRFGFLLGVIYEHWRLPFIHLEDERYQSAKFLCCELNITDGVRTESVAYSYQPPERRQLQPERDLEGLREDFKNLYEQKKLCDVVLRVGDQDFEAHRVVLCARSPVFCAMFELNTKEKTSNVVDITDVEGDTMSRLLLFMYTGTLEDNNFESALSLYTAADKYEVLFLKDRCAGRVVTDLSAQNVCQVLKLADMHHDVGLERIARAFLCSNLADVMNSDEWRMFMIEEMEMASRFMHEVLVKKIGFKS